jgi:hypothetical protein
MFRPALSGWRTSSCVIVAGIAASLMLGACGGQPRQDASEPSGTFPVAVTTATFPASQRLAQHTHLVIAVRNIGHQAIPNIAVTITDPKRGTSVQAFQQYLSMPGLASHSRPVWVIDQAPEPAGAGCGYSCTSGGSGGAVIAYANTWALGSLAPGATATFRWALTAVASGTHAIQYEVAAGLNGKAKARLSGGGIPKQTLTIRISSRPAQAYVNNSGQVVSAR